MPTSHYFEYDLARQRTAMADPTGRTTFGYDALGRLSSRSNPQGFNLTYDYDAVGNRTRLQDPDGVNLYYRYDAVNRMIETSSGTYGGYITYYEFDLADECVHEGRQNKTISYYGFDAAGRTSLIEHRDDGSVVYERYDFDRDEAGNILRRPRASDTDTTYWNYDPAGRITRELWKTGFAGANLYAFEYAYDPAGNRQSKRNAINSQTTYWEYDQADETTLQRSGAPVTVYFTYDANGNVSVEHDVDPSAGLTYYEYDPRNLLTRVGFPAPLSEDKFTFNALGERVSRIDSTDKRQYVWDGLDVILETDMGGPPQTLQRLVKGYTPINGIGSYALQDIGGKPIYPYKDQVGTTILHTDDSAAEVNNYRNMDAWGVQFETPPETFPQEYRFTGKQTDPDFIDFNSQNRRYHFPARFYLPARGLFGQCDPIGLLLPTLRDYRYGKANPVDFVDQMGFQECRVCGPDISDWLNVEIDKWYRFAHSVEDALQGRGPYWTKSLEYGALAVLGLQPKYFPNTTFRSLNCPRDCSETVTLCGGCIHVSEIGNLMYGILARIFRMTWIQTWGGGKIGGRGKQTDSDRAGIEAGYDFVDRMTQKGVYFYETICEFLKRRHRANLWIDLQKDGKGCPPCQDAVPADAFHTIFPPIPKDPANDPLKVSLPITVEGRRQGG